jgi:hypothetical protein
MRDCANGQDALSLVGVRTTRLADCLLAVPDFPDLVVTFDKLEPRVDRTAFHWTLIGTHAGTGNHVRISGDELWNIDNAGLIAGSSGRFDAAEYERQLKHGLGPQ